jgi:hypothetical protein
VRGAMLVFQRTGGWEQIPARLETGEKRVRVSAIVPEGTTAYFFNLDVDGLTLSSELN